MGINMKNKDANDCRGIIQGGSTTALVEAEEPRGDGG